MMQPREPALLARNRTTLWVSHWTRQQIIRLQRPDETVDELLQRVLAEYCEMHAIPSPEEVTP